MWSYNVRKVALLLVTVVVSACGWHLQTLRPLPVTLLPVYVDLSDSQSPFARSLQRSLQSAGVQTTKEITTAASVLTVSKDESGRQVTSISALNQPQQYQIYYRVDYRFERRDQQTQAPTSGFIGLIPIQSLNAARTMSYDITLALAKQREELLIAEELANELTQSVLRRLNALPVSD
jgi:LPS-assembly lipoprotein